MPEIGLAIDALVFLFSMVLFAIFTQVDYQSNCGIKFTRPYLEIHGSYEQLQASYFFFNKLKCINFGVVRKL